MFGFLKSYALHYKKSLFSINNTPLSTSSKRLLLLFVIVIFIIMSQALHWQQRQLMAPYEAFGSMCRSFATQKEPWKLNDFTRSYSAYNYSFGRDKLCQDFAKVLTPLAKEIQESEAYKRIQTLNEQRRKHVSAIATLKTSYESMLLEKIANQEQAHSILTSNSASIKHDIEALQAKIDTIDSTVATLSKLESFQNYASFLSYYQTYHTKITEAIAKKERFYPLERLVNALLFLAPLWLLFYVLYRFFLRKNYPIFSHLSLHVANVSALYALFYGIVFIYDIMPKLFLERLLGFLMQYNLTIVFNIVAIGFFFLLFGFIIYRVQKNGTTGVKKRNEELKNLKTSKCSECATLITSAFCPVCGFSHYHTCPSCNATTLRKGAYCQACGEAQAMERPTT